MTASAELPRIIQGGMGAGVSDWRLARAVSESGQLGVVAGTALDVILARRLQLGDPGGHMRRALEHLPLEGVAARALERWFVPRGKERRAPFAPMQPHRLPMTRAEEELLVAANFVEVFLAREGHDGPVGINYLEKIQLPTLPSLFGALLAGVDYVLMGAGLPRAIPGVLDRLVSGVRAKLKLDVAGATEEFFAEFDPEEFCAGPAPRLERPRFIAIVSSSAAATRMCRKASGRVDGLVVEGPTAGGHNAPPRGKMRVDENGEPVYGERDIPDLEAIAALGVPFWLAGSYGSNARLREALALGAAGVQVGTAFAFCEESGLAQEIKRTVVAQSRAGATRVSSDPRISPTGFPFKVLDLPDSISREEAVECRARTCDLGYLRHAYQRSCGGVGWRCPAEPISVFVRKGGAAGDAEGKACICNGLLANIGLGQVRRGQVEKPLVTSGEDVCRVARFVPDGSESYRAEDVVRAISRVD